MATFSARSVLKAWIDHVVMAGQTFRRTAEGRPERLLTGKRAFIIVARGGVYGEGPFAAYDHQEPYLRAVLGWIGVTDVGVIRVESIAYGPDKAAAALARAREKAARLGHEARAA